MMTAESPIYTSLAGHPSGSGVGGGGGGRGRGLGGLGGRGERRGALARGAAAGDGGPVAVALRVAGARVEGVLPVPPQAPRGPGAPGDGGGGAGGGRRLDAARGAEDGVQELRHLDHLGTWWRGWGREGGGNLGLSGGGGGSGGLGVEVDELLVLDALAGAHVGEVDEVGGGADGEGAPADPALPQLLLQLLGMAEGVLAALVLLPRRQGPAHRLHVHHVLVWNIRTYVHMYMDPVSAARDGHAVLVTEGKCPNWSPCERKWEGGTGTQGEPRMAQPNHTTCGVNLGKLTTPNSHKPLT